MALPRRVLFDDDSKVVITESGLAMTPRVLVVDDEDVVREVIGALLDASSLPYDEAHDGVAALQCLSRTTYSAVILDLMMPVMDGFTVLRSLASKNPRLVERVIILSAARTELLALIDQPVFGLLEEPFARAELLTMVRSCLRTGAG
jgi:CheY-like chemotaxis protein